MFEEEQKMSKKQSPGYPNFALPKAIEHVRKIFSADRRNPIDREVAAKHLGYGGVSGASDKAIGSLGHYGLVEKAGKGQIKVTQLAVDILHPDNAGDRKAALQAAAMSPDIFRQIQERFSDGLPSEDNLKSWLTREEFLDRAINPVCKAYLETCNYLAQEEALEDTENIENNDEFSIRPKVSHAVAEENQKATEDNSEIILETDEYEWISNRIAKNVSARILIRGGQIGPKEISRLISILEVQSQILEDDYE
ncbi:MAG: hypothetical protein AAF213_01800 [Pseudomonadota bacterium]